MRKRQKEQLLEVVKTFEEAHNEIRSALEKGDCALAQGLLADCQQLAIELGNAIETAEGENAVTVCHIEEYCEALYFVYEQLQSTLPSQETMERLEEKLYSIESSIKDDITVRLEVVFLPYKASMWDSLESVWRAADADENCDAYVVPIPYFEKNQDGSLGVMHDESGEYPEDVPIVSWREYDITKRCPDMIFIHNPYDEYNMVTSVHPAFYASELKKYTDKLIYIPYFVATGKVEEHFCVLPGTLYADKVILQSESVRDTYISVFGRWAKETGYEKAKPDWQERFLALGSPKFDKVSSTGRNDANLPEEWKAKLYRADGARKKSFFYNTSVQALLDNPTMLQKIKYTLQVFKENKDVVLWWRPHPLYESTLEAMRPELLAEYREIVAKYKEEDWGIFDDTADMNRAIAETDAYYGDSGSVVALYRNTGKPVMVQNADVLEPLSEENVKDIPIWPSDFCVDGDDIWFIHGKINVLMKYNMSEQTTKVIGSVPNEKMFQESLYSSIHKHEDKIYLIPCWGREIAIYHISEKRFQKIALDGIEKYANTFLFCKAYAYEKTLFCFSENDFIAKLDLENNKIQQYTWSCYSYDVNYIKDMTLLDGEDTVCGLADGNVICFFDMCKEKIFMQKVECGDAVFSQMVSVGDCIVLYDSSQNRLYKWKWRQNAWEIYGDYEGIKLERVNKKLIIIDKLYSSEFRVLDYNGKCTYAQNGEIPKKEEGLNNLYCRTLVRTVDDKTVYVFNTVDCILYEFENGICVHKYKFFVDDVKPFEDLSRQESVWRDDLLENVFWGLGQLQERILRTVKCDMSHCVQCGELIYDSCKVN